MNIAIFKKLPVYDKGIEYVIYKEFDQANITKVNSFSEFSKIKDLSPDVAIVFSNHSSFHEIIRSLRNHHTGTGIVVIEDGSNEKIGEALFKLLHLGVLGFLTIECDVEALIACIKAAHNGKRYLSSEMLQSLLEHILKEENTFKRQKKEPVLTKNEMEVAIMLSKGERVSIIAQKTGRRVSTISTIKRSVLRKTNSEDVFMLREFIMEKAKYQSSGG